MRLNPRGSVLFEGDAIIRQVTRCTNIERGVTLRSSAGGGLITLTAETQHEAATKNLGKDKSQVTYNWCEIEATERGPYTHS